MIGIICSPIIKGELPMTPYSKFEGVHKKIAILQEIGNYLHSSQNVTNFNHKKIGLWMLLLDEI